MKDGFIKVSAITPNIKVADVDENAAAIVKLAKEAAKREVSIAAFPMLCITGATCGDLFRQDYLIDKAYDALISIVRQTADLDTVFTVGLPMRVGGYLYNVAAVLYKGSVLALIPQATSGREMLSLDSYFVMAEGECATVNVDGKEVIFGSDILINIPSAKSLNIAVLLGAEGYDAYGVINHKTDLGATMIIHMDAAPELVTSEEYRFDRLKMLSYGTYSNIIYVNAGRGESTTDYVFAGQNVITECGRVIAATKCFAYDEEDSSAAAIFECQNIFKEGVLLSTEIDTGKASYERRTKGLKKGQVNDTAHIIKADMPYRDVLLTGVIDKSPFVSNFRQQSQKDCRKILKMQAEGLRRRMQHTGSKTAVIGISGGLDSTLALLVTHKAYMLLGLNPKDILAVTMPGFGTTKRTKSNAVLLAKALGCSVKEVSIERCVTQHLEDIGHDISNTDVTYENAQARERTQILMDMANDVNGIVIGTGDLSEMALGWCTYNGDHMSMYAVNAGIPKTMLRTLVSYYADNCCGEYEEAAAVLRDVLNTPVSPELLPPKDGEISQCTEDLVGPYELHDFFLYYVLRWGYSPAKVLRLAEKAFEDEYSKEEILKWEKKFFYRFIGQQFKRSCMTDGPKIGSVGLSPRGDLRMPSDAASKVWTAMLENM